MHFLNDIFFCYIRNKTRRLWIMQTTKLQEKEKKRSSEEIRKKTTTLFSFSNAFLPYQVISMIHETTLLNG